MCNFYLLRLQIDSSIPSSNMSIVSDVMKAGILAVDIDTRDEGSGVQSIDMYYQKISGGDGKLLVSSWRRLGPDFNHFRPRTSSATKNVSNKENNGSACV